VLDHGHLVERGRFDELVRRGGLFARLASQGEFTNGGDVPLGQAA